MTIDNCFHCSIKKGTEMRNSKSHKKKKQITLEFLDGNTFFHPKQNRSDFKQIKFNPFQHWNSEFFRLNDENDPTFSQLSKTKQTKIHVCIFFSSLFTVSCDIYKFLVVFCFRIYWAINFQIRTWKKKKFGKRILLKRKNDFVLRIKFDSFASLSIQCIRMLFSKLLVFEIDDR